MTIPGGLELAVYWVNEEDIKASEISGKEIPIDKVVTKNIMFYTIDSVSHSDSEDISCFISSGGEEFQVIGNYKTVNSMIRERSIFNFN